VTVQRRSKRPRAVAEKPNNNKHARDNKTFVAKNSDVLGFNQKCFMIFLCPDSEGDSETIMSAIGKNIMTRRRSCRRQHRPPPFVRPLERRRLGCGRPHVRGGAFRSAAGAAGRLGARQRLEPGLLRVARPQHRLEPCGCAREAPLHGRAALRRSPSRPRPSAAPLGRSRGRSGGRSGERSKHSSQHGRNENATILFASFTRGGR
jgi:hypothetical protein